MAGEIQTSFIPKQNLTRNAVAVSDRASLGIFMLIGLVIFALSLIVFAGAYSYHYLLDQSINRPCVAGSDQGCGLRESLDKDKRELQLDRIIGFSRRDAKMKAAAGIINNHVALLPLFDVIQSLTLQNIRYTKFDYSDKGISIEGLALGYEDVAVQLKVFKESKLITSAVFSGLSLDQKGNVTFKLALTVDPKLVSYSNTLASSVNQLDSLVMPPAITASSSVSNNKSASTTNFQ